MITIMRRTKNNFPCEPIEEEMDIDEAILWVLRGWMGLGARVRSAYNNAITLVEGNDWLVDTLHIEGTEGEIARVKAAIELYNKLKELNPPEIDYVASAKVIGNMANTAINHRDVARDEIKSLILMAGAGLVPKASVTDNLRVAILTSLQVEESTAKKALELEACDWKALLSLAEREAKTTGKIGAAIHTVAQQLGL